MSSRRTVRPSQGEKAQGVHTLHALLDVGVQHLCVGLQNLDVGMERFSPYQTPALDIDTLKRRAASVTGPIAVSHAQPLAEGVKVVKVVEDGAETVILEKLRIFTCCQITDALGEAVVRYIEENQSRFSGVEVIRATPPFNRKYIDGDAKEHIQKITDRIKDTVEHLGGTIIDLDVPSFGFEPFYALRTLVDGDGDAAYQAKINAMCGELGIPIPMRNAGWNKAILESAVGPKDFRITDLAEFLRKHTQKGFDAKVLTQADLDSALLVEKKLTELHNKILEMKNIGGAIEYEDWIKYLQNDIIDETHRSTWKAAENLDERRVATLLGLTPEAQKYHMLQEDAVKESDEDRKGKKPLKADKWLAKVLTQLVTIPSYCLDAVAFASAVADNRSVTQKKYESLVKVDGNVKSGAVFQRLSTTISNVLKGGEETLERGSLWLPHLHVVDLEMDDGFSMLLHTALLRALNKDNSVLPSFMVQLPLLSTSPTIKAISDNMREQNGWTVIHDPNSLNVDKILKYYEAHF